MVPSRRCLNSFHADKSELRAMDYCWSSFLTAGGADFGGGVAVAALTEDAGPALGAGGADGA